MSDMSFYYSGSDSDCLSAGSTDEDGLLEGDNDVLAAHHASMHGQDGPVTTWEVFDRNNLKNLQVSAVRIRSKPHRYHTCMLIAFLCGGQLWT